MNWKIIDQVYRISMLGKKFEITFKRRKAVSEVVPVIKYQNSRRKPTLGEQCILQKYMKAEGFWS